MDARLFAGRLFVTGAMQIQVLPEDYLSGVRLNLRPRRAWAIAGVSLLALSVVGAGILLWKAALGDANGFDLVFPLAATWLALWYWVLLPWRVRRLYAQQRSLHQPFEAAFDAIGMHVKSKSGEATLLWRDVHKWRESKRLFLIYPSDALFNLLPKRCFGSEAEQTILRSHLLAQVGLPGTVRKT